MTQNNLRKKFTYNIQNNLKFIIQNNLLNRTVNNMDFNIVVFRI